jgi:hypothetical protein
MRDNAIILSIESIFMLHSNHGSLANLPPPQQRMRGVNRSIRNSSRNRSRSRDQNRNRNYGSLNNLPLSDAEIRPRRLPSLSPHANADDDVDIDVLHPPLLPPQPLVDNNARIMIPQVQESDIKTEDESWNGEDYEDLFDDNIANPSQPLRFEDPQLDNLVDHTQWDQYVSPDLIRLLQRVDPLVLS